MTYHAAGELLQGGAAALFSVCWLLFGGGGKQGEGFGSGQGVGGVGSDTGSGGEGTRQCKHEGRGQCGGRSLGNGVKSVTGQQGE